VQCRYEWYKSARVFTVGCDSTDGGKRHVLIMDEVDGMAGNEDRGGISVSVI